MKKKLIEDIEPAAFLYPFARNLRADKKRATSIASYEDGYPIYDGCSQL